MNLDPTEAFGPSIDDFDGGLAAVDQTHVPGHHPRRRRRGRNPRVVGTKAVGGRSIDYHHEQQGRQHGSKHGDLLNQNSCIFYPLDIAPRRRYPWI
jgi:hypothetical protein